MNKAYSMQYLVLGANWSYKPLLERHTQICNTWSRSYMSDNMVHFISLNSWSDKAHSCIIASISSSVITGYFSCSASKRNKRMWYYSTAIPGEELQPVKLSNFFTGKHLIKLSWQKTLPWCFSVMSRLYFSLQSVVWLSICKQKIYCKCDCFFLLPMLPIKKEIEWSGLKKNTC